MARAPTPLRSAAAAPIRFGDWLSLQKSIAGPVTQLMYLAGLGLICLVGFGVVGAFVGAALREGSLEGILLAIPGLIGGVLGIAVAGLLWRWLCELYVAMFRIADDLSALRASAEGRQALGSPEAGGVPRTPAQRVTN